MNLVKEITEKITDIPTLSTVASHLLTAVQEKDHSIQDLVKIIENDVALTSRILRVANSAAFAPRYPITTLPRAVGHLGENMIIGLALGSCTTQLYLQPLEGYEATRLALWEHSLLTAISSEAVSVHAKNRLSGDEAFTAGLLHDIGKSVLSEFMKDDVKKLSHWIDDGIVLDFLQAERGLLKTDHTEVGAAIAKRWNLGKSLEQCIHYHHRPGKAKEEYRPIVYCVHLGDILAQMIGKGTGADTLGYRLEKDYQDYFDLSGDQLGSILLDVQDKFYRIKGTILQDEEE